MRVTIRHTTRYISPEPARASFNEVRLTPRNDERQNLLSFALSLSPKARTTTYRDHFGTMVYAFNVWGPHDRLEITGESRVVTYPRAPLPAPDEPRAGALGDLEDAGFRDTMAEWLHPSALASGGEALATFAQHVRQVIRPASTLALIVGVTSEVHRRFDYVSGTSYVSSTVDDLLGRGTGVCQDFSHLMIATLRDLGVPARYVSGYFYAGEGDPQPDTVLDVESHAWVAANIPGLGWVAMDPTNDCPADERHVTVAVGRDYSDVAPVQGVLHGGSGQQMEVAVTMVAPSMPFPATPLLARPGPPSRRMLVAGQQPGQPADQQSEQAQQ